MQNLLRAQTHNRLGMGGHDHARSSDLSKQIVQVREQHLQLLHRRRRGTPERRTFLGTEARQEQSIMAIGFGANTFTGAKGGHTRGIGQAHLVTVLIEKVRDQVAVGAGGFQAGVHLLVALTQQPLLELSQALLLIGKTLERASGGFWQEHAHIQGEFGDIHADGSEGLVHRKVLLV